MEPITRHLVNSLRGKGAHVPLDRALEGLSWEKTGERIEGLEHTIWMLLYHIWICARDIVEFSIAPGHESPRYPSGYWPESEKPESESQWEEMIKRTNEEIERMAEMIADPSADLQTPFPWGTGQNLFREALILLDHNSYHLAQIIDMRALQGVPVKDW